MTPYLFGGPDLTKTHLDFFDVTPKAGCSFTCNYGDTCGGTISELSVTQTSTDPFTVTYKSNIVAGYSTTDTFCISCSVTNGY